jgi:hypothetical protein
MNILYIVFVQMLIWVRRRIGDKCVNANWLRVNHSSVIYFMLNHVVQSFALSL